MARSCVGCQSSGWHGSPDRLLGALVMVPACGVLLRHRRRVLTAVLLFSLVSLATVLVCVAWLHKQPYWIANDLSTDLPVNVWSKIVLLVFEVSGFIVSLLLILSPVLVPWITKARCLGTNKSAIVVVLLGIVSFMILAAGRPIPWIPHMFSSMLWGRYSVTGMLQVKQTPALLFVSFSVLLPLTLAALVFLERVVSRTGENT